MTNPDPRVPTAGLPEETVPSLPDVSATGDASTTTNADFQKRLDRLEGFLAEQYGYVFDNYS